MTESDAVRLAILDSQKIGTLSDELVRLVHLIVRRRCGAHGLQDDLAQETCLRLLRRLHTIDADANPYHYVCSAIVGNWQNLMRKRRRERRYLIHEVERLIAEMPVASRATARGAAMASWDRVTRMKYY